MAQGEIEALLERWLAAGVIDGVTAELIRDFERERPAALPRLRWPAIVAAALGGLLVGAGVLLFVAAHWERFPPGTRFAMVVAMVAGFHVLGALGAASAVLASTLHAVGTVALGAGIALSGQVFHLAAHWPTGVFLWAAGAALGWLVLLDWPQAVLTAVLVPAWLSGQWLQRAWTAAGHAESAVVADGLLLAALAYLGAERPTARSPVRQALAWVGALALLPAGAAVTFLVESGGSVWPPGGGEPGRYVVAWLVAFAAPIAVAALLGGRRGALVVAVAAAWVCAGPAGPLDRVHWSGGWTYAWSGVLALAVIAWGVWEASARRINLGFAGFALAVMGFYFANVMDRLDRAASMVGLGVVFLAGGWILDHTRRRVVARAREGA